MNEKTLIKIMLDIVMTILFVSLIYAYDTGLVFHEIVGLSISALFATHIVLNWLWVKNVTRNLFNKRLTASAKLKYALNVTTFLVLATVIITGIFISQVIFPSLGSMLGNKVLLLIHTWTSYLCLGLFGLHIALHGRYLLESGRKMLVNFHESKVRKTFLRLAASALIIGVLYSRVIAIETENVNNQSRIYGNQLVSSSQTTTAIKGRDDRSSNQVYENNAKVDGEAITLSDYLGSMHCTTCHRNCSLLTPQCGKADRQIKSAKITYQEQYGDTAS